RDPIDLLVVITFGILGYFMRRFGYPRPAMILGLVLGDLMEKYLYRSVASYGFSWLARPAVIVLFILAAGSLILTLRGRLKTRDDSPASLGAAMARTAAESWFAACCRCSVRGGRLGRLGMAEHRQDHARGRCGHSRPDSGLGPALP